MKKIIVFAILSLILVTPVLALSFDSKIDAKNYEQDVLNNIEYTFKITGIEQKLNSNELEVFWNVKIFKKTAYVVKECTGEIGKEVCKDVTKYSYEYYVNEILSSKVPEDYTDNQIENLVKKHAEEFVERWKPEVKYKVTKSIIGKEIKLFEKKVLI